MTERRLETDRLILVPPAPAHIAAYTDYCGSDRSRFVGGPFDRIKAFEKFCAMAGHWAMRSFGRYVIVAKATEQPIGHVGALQLDLAEAPEMTWTLWSDAAEGQGYAFEAAEAYVKHASHSLTTDKMMIRIDQDNARSIRLAIRLGAELDAGAVAPAWMPNATTFFIRL